MVNISVSDGSARVLSPSSAKFWSRSERKIWLCILFAICVVVYAVRSVMPLCIVAVSHEYQWNKTEMGTVLSSFFWGYATSQVIGGYLSDRFGAETVIVSAMLGWSTVTFLTPVLARMCCESRSGVLHMFVFLRVLTGSIQGVHFPSVHSLLSRRVLVGERAFSVGFAVSGTHIGTVLTGAVGSILLVKYGWEFLFYLIGMLGLIPVVFLSRYLRSCNVSAAAVASNSESLIKAESSPSLSVPWITILSKAPFWAVFVGQFCGCWIFYILFSWLPTYFTETFPTANGWVFNAVPWLVSVPCQLFAGWFSDRLVSKGYSTTFVRKLAQTSSFCGAGIFILLMPYIGHNYTAALFCMSTAIGFCAFHHCGVVVNVQDITPKFTGSVYGLVNTAGAVPGFIGVYVAGYLLQTFHTWSAVFHSTAAVAFVGAVVYLKFGSGEQVV